MSMLTVEECELLTDSKYRSYITHVEKALRNFDYTSEWADLISALGKLNKVSMLIMIFFSLMFHPGLSCVHEYMGSYV